MDVGILQGALAEISVAKFVLKVGYLSIELLIIVDWPCIILLPVMNVLLLSFSILSLRIVPFPAQIIN